MDTSDLTNVCKLEISAEGFDNFELLVFDC